ncbi:TetR/AcrR family transcriptional regulator [Bacillus sp. ISL-55]|uniref:TetR/AcrR family transcriptional regulator n=1 Tax=Bacillus sp. ISL-55 TaxID=2819134 RepID=UPI001BE751F5|nr:TetR/AcrR family transcriptional regulator [Bacillus sp. ISL-55]MBT2694517.1 TetR/AcrR family transcriptional regulator [Bacillus sp. ISL-55]
MTIKTNSVIQFGEVDMATAFTESEKEQIRKRLMEAAADCLGRYGVKKTTVDQLVQLAGISKGAFYQFFASKELLFFHVLEDFQGSLMEEGMSALDGSGATDSDAFTEFIFDLFQRVRHSFMMNLIQNGELEVLMRKIPEEEIARHHSFDDRLAEKLFSDFSIKGDPHVAAATLRAIFLSMLHVKEVGEEQFDQALKMLIRGVALQLIGEDSEDERCDCHV